jgi:hypothetical protein
VRHHDVILPQDMPRGWTMLPVEGLLVAQTPVFPALYAGAQGLAGHVAEPHASRGPRRCHHIRRPRMPPASLV